MYTVAVSAFLGGSKPSRFGNVRGDVAVSFSCDPDVAWKLVRSLSMLLMIIEIINKCQKVISVYALSYGLEL